ncbi:MAG: hypothetical protein IJU55_00185, partial [Selenomonadaceae bacterium]|nr:hypothetical protein [Selenomonadaceae bacterium]
REFPSNHRYYVAVPNKRHFMQRLNSTVMILACQAQFIPPLVEVGDFLLIKVKLQFLNPRSRMSAPKAADSEQWIVVRKDCPLTTTLSAQRKVTLKKIFFLKICIA